MDSYRLSAWVRARDGTVTPFTLEVAAPEEHPDGGWGCVVTCAIMPFNGKPLFGVDGRQALALALWITNNQLQHKELELIDAGGNPIALPIDRGAGISGGADRDDLC